MRIKLGKLLLSLNFIDADIEEYIVENFYQFIVANFSFKRLKWSLAFRSRVDFEKNLLILQAKKYRRKVVTTTFSDKFSFAMMAAKHPLLGKYYFPWNKL